MKLFNYLLVFFTAAPLLIFAQKTEEIQQAEQKRINQFIAKNLWQAVPDSSAAFFFAFRITVKKNLKGNAEVLSITASDTIAYRIYRDYHSFLKTINYTAFMKGRKDANFIIPVVLEVYGSKGDPIPQTSVFDQANRLFYSSGLDTYANIYFKCYQLRLDKHVYD